MLSITAAHWAPHAHVTAAALSSLQPRKNQRPSTSGIFPSWVYGNDLQLNKITEQISLIVMDAMSLAEASDPLARDLLSKAGVQRLEKHCAA